MMQRANYDTKPAIFAPVDTRILDGPHHYRFNIVRDDIPDDNGATRESWTCDEIIVPSLDASAIKECLICEYWSQSEREALINNYNAAMNGQADAKYIEEYNNFNRRRKLLKRQVDNDLRLHLGREKSLSEAIKERLSDIEDHDTSEAVNSFLVNGVSCWIDAKTRAVYRGIIETAKGRGDEMIGLSLGGLVIPTIPIEMAAEMLAGIEYYAYNAAMVTACHRAVVAQLNSVEEVDAYDFTAGYPDRVIINLPMP